MVILKGNQNKVKPQGQTYFSVATSHEGKLICPLTRTNDNFSIQKIMRSSYLQK